MTAPRPRTATLIDGATTRPAWQWLLLAAAILMIDYATGPFIQFPILFILPVVLATASAGIRVGCAVAVVLPLLRLSFFLQWDLPAGWALEIIDIGVDVVILVAFAFLVSHILRQHREIRVLEGLLPMCSFCKRIREEGGQWRQLETYIGERSGARFSHTFCDDCGRKHYPGMVD
jgi:hypothetical protein